MNILDKKSIYRTISTARFFSETFYQISLVSEDSKVSWLGVILDGVKNDAFNYAFTELKTESMIQKIVSKKNKNIANFFFLVN